MRRCIAVIFAAVLMVVLAACGQKEESNSVESVISAPSEETAITESDSQSSPPESEDTGSHILIAYFSVPENVDISGVDAVAGASVVVRNSEKMGNTEYVAKVIQQTVGGDLFRIETVEEYPLDHDPLVDQAADEQDEKKRPELLNQVENFEQYETIILGFPNWWADLPMPVYTFLEEYDFSGKTIIPFVTHGGSGFSGTVRTISDIQPQAEVSDNTLSLSRNAVAGSAEDVIAWAESLAATSSGWKSLSLSLFTTKQTAKMPMQAAASMENRNFFDLKIFFMV